MDVFIGEFGLFGLLGNFRCFLMLVELRSLVLFLLLRGFWGFFINIF